MIEIVACLQGTCPHLAITTLRQLSRIILALLAMTGRVTMLGLSRWAGQDSSTAPRNGSFTPSFPGAWSFGPSFVATCLTHKTDIFLLVMSVW